VSVVCNCCWSSPAQSFSGQSPTGPHFTVSDSRLPQPAAPGPCIHIPQQQGGRLYPQALGSLFVAYYDSQGYGGGIRPPLHTSVSITRSVSQSVILRPTVSRPFYLGIKHPSGAYDQIFIMSDHCGFLIWASSLTRGRVCLLQCTMYNVHYTVYFTVSDLRQGPCIYIPQEKGGPVIPPGTG
jgi:hypothetical protein